VNGTLALRYPRFTPLGSRVVTLPLLGEIPPVYSGTKKPKHTRQKKKMFFSPPYPHSNRSNQTASHKKPRDSQRRGGPSPSSLLIERNPCCCCCWACVDYNGGVCTPLTPRLESMLCDTYLLNKHTNHSSCPVWLLAFGTPQQQKNLQKQNV
jgi:hypothetical protein